MLMSASPFLTPWKICNELHRWFIYPYVRLIFALEGVAWGKGWRIYGVPIVQRHRQSRICIGDNLQLRSSLLSNPLGPYHPVMITTWQSDAVINIGDNFGMTGGVLCAAQKIEIGNYVIIGANSLITDTDFHPLDWQMRRTRPQKARTAPVIIEDDVFIGMECLILKGVIIGRGSVIGAGSIVTRSVPPNVIAAGNPARVLRQLGEQVK